MKSPAVGYKAPGLWTTPSTHQHHRVRGCVLPANGSSRRTANGQRFQTSERSREEVRVGRRRLVAPKLMPATAAVAAELP
jgi:hypothetical protein